MTLKSQWLHDPFLSLNPVTIERDHDLCTKSINKSVRNFERMGLPACQDIAVQIKKEVRVVVRVVVTVLDRPMPVLSRSVL